MAPPSTMPSKSRELLGLPLEQARPTTSLSPMIAPQLTDSDIDDDLFSSSSVVQPPFSGPSKANAEQMLRLDDLERKVNLLTKSHEMVKSSMTEEIGQLKASVASMVERLADTEMREAEAGSEEPAGDKKPKRRATKATNSEGDGDLLEDKPRQNQVDPGRIELQVVLSHAALVAGADAFDPYDRSEYLPRGARYKHVPRLS